LFFAGGGSLGAVEVGMLRALVEHGEKADFIVGASAGAINGRAWSVARAYASLRRCHTCSDTARETNETRMASRAQI
jgi:predicted acylesterase/phospholipase RssA